MKLPNWKRILSLSLTVCFMLALLPTVALAADTLTVASEADWSSYYAAGSEITLDENGDVLNITADAGPNQPIKIIVSAPAGSSVTITGREDILYENVYILGYNNNITLNIENLSIKAPPTDGQAFPGIFYRYDSGFAALNVSGVCAINGGDTTNTTYIDGGYGIRAGNQLSDLAITGDGKLTVTGGEGKAFGSGINAKDLTIEAQTTVRCGETTNHQGGGAAILLTGKLTVNKKLMVYGAANTGGNTVASNGPVVINAETIVYAGDSDLASGCDGGNGILTQDIEVNAPLTITGGNSEAGQGGGGIGATNITVDDDLTVTGGSGVTSRAGASLNDMIIHTGTVTIRGGNSKSNPTNDMGMGLSCNNSMTMTGGTVSITGGSDQQNSGGRGIQAYGDVSISGGTLTVAGGNGGIYGGHGIFSINGDITIESGANVTATGGDGTAQLGGVGIRAFGETEVTSDNWQVLGKTVTIAEDAGEVSVWGGIGAGAVQRAAIMGGKVYIATGSVGGILEEAQAPSFEIKNVPNGDALSPLTVNTSPAATVTLSAVVATGATGLTPDYTYFAPTGTDGAACLWLPAGSQTILAAGYTSAGVTIPDHTQVMLTGIPATTAVSWTGLTANGTANTTDTTLLTLTFDVEPTGLAIGDITVTGATKGTLTGSGVTRTLTISGITVGEGQDVTVAIGNPSGFTITPPSKTVAVHKAPSGGITAGSKMDIGGETNVPLDSGPQGDLASKGWKWDMDTATLTLGSGYSGSNNSIYIECDPSDNITLQLDGDVTINSNSWGINVVGLDSFSTGGSLTIQAGFHTLSVTANGDAIQAHNGVIIESGTVVADGGSGGLVSYYGGVTISSSANVTVNGSYNGIQTADDVMINTSGTVDTSGGWYGMNAIHGGITIKNGTVLANGGNHEALISVNGVDVTGGILTTNTSGSANGDISGGLTVSGANTSVNVNGSVTNGGNLTVSDGNVTVTGTVAGTTNVTGGTVLVNGQIIPPPVIGSDLVVQGNDGGNGTSAGPGADGASMDITKSDPAFDSITVISGNGGDSGGGNQGGNGGKAKLTLTAPNVVVSGDVLVKTGNDGDNNTGAWCGVPTLKVEGTLRTPSITVQSTNGGEYWVNVKTLDVSEDTVIAVSGIDGGSNCSFETVKIADGKTLTVKNANGKLFIGAVQFTGNGTGQILIEDASCLGMNELNFFHNPAFAIPAGAVGTPIASINVSKGVVSGPFVTKPYAFSAAGLPAGINIDPSTGVISGTLTAASAAGTATIIVTDTAQTSKSITISYGTISVGGGGGGGGGVTTPASTAPVVSGGTATTTVTPTVSNGTASASIPGTQVTSAIETAKAAAEKSGEKPAVKIAISGASGVDKTALTLPQSAVQSLVTGGIDALTLSSPVAAVSFDSGALSTINSIASGNVTVTAARASNDSLPEAARTLVGDRPVYDLSVTSGGKAISSFGGTVTVSIPYTPAAGEDTANLVIYYISDSGSVERVPNTRYDVATGSIVFTTTHFSYYAVGYEKALFSDVLSDAWYYDAVTFIAEKGVTTGTGGGKFNPDATLTRGQFITMLLRTYGIEADANPADNFSDAGNTYYTGYLAAAKAKGIASGVGENKFAPEQPITRQEMFTLLYNALKVIGQLPTGDSSKTLTDFTDSGDIASWAVDAMTALVESGTVSGSDGKLGPKETTTRAQMAQVLYNLLGK